MALAPIVLFLYDRRWHAQQTIDSLKKNTLAGDSDLFVFSDGPKSAVDGDKVSSVREYIRTIEGFKSVTVTERDKNFGLAQSIITAVTEIVNRYGSIIVLEDDLFCAEYFLNFMNEALVYYKDDDRVISIHGYTYPVKKQLPQTFFLKGADCWGWATWKRGWDNFEPDGNRLLAEIIRSGTQRAFDYDGAYPFTQMLKDQIAGKNDSWAIRWYASAFLKDKLTLYPGVSLIQNIGNDSSGTHSGRTDAFFTEISESKINITSIPVMENSFVKNEIGVFLNSLKPNLLRRVINKIIGLY